MKNHQTFVIESVIKQYPGPGGWHYISLSEELTKRVREIISMQAPWGCVPILAAIEKTQWSTALFLTRGVYIMSLKAEIRKKLKLQLGDTVKITINLKETNQT